MKNGLRFRKAVARGMLGVGVDVKKQRKFSMQWGTQWQLWNKRQKMANGVNSEVNVFVRIASSGGRSGQAKPNDALCSIRANESETDGTTNCARRLKHTKQAMTKGSESGKDGEEDRETVEAEQGAEQKAVVDEDTARIDELLEYTNGISAADRKT